MHGNVLHFRSLLAIWINILSKTLNNESSLFRSFFKRRHARHQARKVTQQIEVCASF